MRSHSVLAFAVIISFAVFYSMWHLDIYLQNNVTSNDGQLRFEHFKMLVASMIIALCTSSVRTFIIMAFAGRCDLDVETGPLFGIISIAGLIGVYASSHRLLNQYLMDLTK